MSTALAYNESHRGHRNPGHVERPERLDAVMNRLDKHPTWDLVTRIAAESASLDDLRRVHTDEHIDAVRRAIQTDLHRLDPDTYITPDSLRAALDAVGCLLSVTREVIEGRFETGFAAIRPPGHHATPSKSMGFCLFANVAIAVRWVQDVFGISRVLVVDFDVHHGNGTQDTFYEDPSVMYASLHQSPLYPGTGHVHERGRGAGQNTTVNVPLPSGTGDAAYLRVFQQILAPLVLDFHPEIIFVSAGYDAHWKDLLGGMRMTTTGIANIVRELVDWARTCCHGHLVASLEGGYHIEALAESVAATIEIMNDRDAEVRDVHGAPPGEDLDVTDYLDEVRAIFDV